MQQSPPQTVEDAILSLFDEVPPFFFRLRALTESLHESTGFSPPERAVLRDLVQRGAMSVPALAAMRGVTRQAVQPVVDTMSRRGLVAQALNPIHRRSPLYRATALGANAHQAMRRIEIKALQAKAGDVSLAQATTALEVVVHLSGLLAEGQP